MEHSVKIEDVELTSDDEDDYASADEDECKIKVKRTKITDNYALWATLSHKGPIFPTPYKPHGIKVKYNGVEVDLNPEQEELATMYAEYRQTHFSHREKTFQENFWKDWQEMLGGEHVIKDLSSCDFGDIETWLDDEKKRKKDMKDKEKLQEADEEIENKWAYVDGKKMEVSCYQIEPPGLFIGRGKHPKNGMLKRRINPSDVVINIGDTSQTPRCPIPGCWKKVVRDPHVKWLAYWKDSISGRRKYMNLKYCSTKSDISKFNTARELKINQAEIKRQYTVDFTSSNLVNKQCAIVTYLIDTLALRPGHVKDEEITAPTVGCCTLMVKNVILHEPSCLEFRFTGKASVDYENQVEVENLVFNCIKEFQLGKSPEDNLFDKLDAKKLNGYLQNLGKPFGLHFTAKTFRTFRASEMMDDLLNKEDLMEKTEEDKLAVYWDANKEVAIFLNHRRDVASFDSKQAYEFTDQIYELEAQKSKLEIQKTHPSDQYYASKAGKLYLNNEIEKIMKKIHELSLQERTISRSHTYRLETSRENYLDPRITVAWCLRHGISVENMFDSRLRNKFIWAMDVESDFRY